MVLKRMKRFLISVLIFVSPVLGYLVLLELLVGAIPNSYSYKYKYVKEHGSRIEALALGHSQLYDGFKPESFALPAFNLSNSSQFFVDNYYLLERLLPDMPHLKVVVMPIGYVDVDGIGYDNTLTDRSCYYHKYMHLNYDGRVPLKYRLECFDPHRASDKVKQYYLKHKDIVGCDSLGRRSTHSLKDREHPLGYERLLDKYTTDHHRDLCIKYEYYLLKSIQLLKEKQIRLVLVSPPCYWEGFERVNEEQQQFVKDYARQLCDSYQIEYIDMESDTSYHDEDFFNETHLSEVGAERFTRTLSDRIVGSTDSVMM